MKPDRGLGIWFRDGVRNILLAVDGANRELAERQKDCPEVRVYRLGFAAAIRSVAAAFGIRIEEK